MKRSALMFLILSMVGMKAGAHDSVESTKSLDSSPQNIVGTSQDQDREYKVYLSGRIREANAGQPLPKLEYWGIQGAEWGMTRQQVEKDLKAKLALQDKKQGVWAAESRNGKFTGLAFRELMVFDGDKEKLKEVRRQIDTKAKTPNERLDLYQQLKKTLVSKYGLPYMSDNEVLQGDKDLYVLGKNKGYHSEWAGPATAVWLQLTETDLVVSFRQAQDFDPDNKIKLQ